MSAQKRWLFLSRVRDIGEDEQGSKQQQGALSEVTESGQCEAWSNQQRHQDVHAHDRAHDYPPPAGLPHGNQRHPEIVCLAPAAPGITEVISTFDSGGGRSGWKFSNHRGQESLRKSVNILIGVI